MQLIHSVSFIVDGIKKQKTIIKIWQDYLWNLLVANQPQYLAKK